MDDIRSQYRIITTGAGWADRSARGRIGFAGRDAQPFLQALVSNEVAALAAGQGVYATYLTPQGRMISDLRIFHRAGYLLADVPAALAERLVASFDALLFAEDVVVSDASLAIGQIAVTGQQAASVVGRALGIDPAALEALPPLAQLDAREVGGVFVARADDSSWPGFDVFMPAAVRESVVRRLDASGAVPVSSELMELLRIEAGRPDFGVDMTEETIPLEAGLLERAISTTKGCYVGQEIIIRVLHRGGGRVARRLSRLELDPSLAVAPAPGAVLSADGREVGKVTSSAFSPARERVVALGYVHRDFAEAGRHVMVATPAGEVDAVILGLAG